MPPSVSYLVSKSFSYQSTISDDAGPTYARRQGWTACPFDALPHLAARGPVVLDNRLTESELVTVREWLTRMTSTRPVYLKVVDPHWECLEQPYYRWLLNLASLPHVFFVGPYQAKRVTALLSELAGRPAYLHVPFAYDPSRELPLSSHARPINICLSGATDPYYYPERHALLSALRRHPMTDRDVSILPHPGYPDIGHELQHHITGEAYLQFLARHRFAYVEPGREALEFIRYSECAYAGCIPVGRFPASFEPTLASLILPLESRNLGPDYDALRARPRELDAAHALQYRTRLAAERNPLALTARVIDHWSSQH